MSKRGGSTISFLERIFFMDVKCILKREVSKKSGKEYYCLYIPDLEKTIFLEPTELKLMKYIYKIEEI